MTNSEIRAYKNHQKIIEITSESEWMLLERFYEAPQSETYARKSLSTLYNNWTDEIYRAAQWDKENHSTHQTKLQQEPTNWGSDRDPSDNEWESAI